MCVLLSPVQAILVKIITCPGAVSTRPPTYSTSAGVKFWLWGWRHRLRTFLRRGRGRWGLQRWWRRRERNFFRAWRGGGGRRLRGLLLGGRPCDHAATVPSSFDLKVPQIQFIGSGWIFLFCVQRHVPTVQTVQFSIEILQVPFLDWFLTCPLLCNARCTVLGCQGRRHLCRDAESVSLGPDCSENH